MESWTRVIVEWINCLEIAQPSVEDVHDLQDCVFYQKLITQLCHGNNEASTNTTTLDERELVSEFIKAEYPEFMMSNECSSGIPDEVYIASLLLTQCSQKAAFHRPMCVNLKHETQIHIKKFLELVLPYGKSITREIIDVAIMEIGDATPNTPPSTPIVRPLREFFNSPAARSAQSQRFMNDRNRELRRLKAQLETEQFEKADLLEDIRIQEEKIHNLQKKLQEKSQELKLLRNEKLKPATPQSCRKNKRPSDNEERYKRELEQCENSNLGLQNEIEKLQDEREELNRRLTSKDRQLSALKEKFDQYERNMEALAIQLEMKNNELFSLRLNNEELREHIREIQRSTMGEQSFEMEPINRARSPMLLNSSEALSSIVDIQLQEAKEESTQLKHHLDAVNERLEIVLNECEEIKKLNAILQEKAKEFDIVSVSLRTTEERLSYSAQKVECLELQKSELMKNLAKLNDELTSNKDLLTIAENRKVSLETELQLATSKSHDLEASLENEKVTTANLESTISRIKEECSDLQKRLATTEDELKIVNENKKILEVDLKEKHKQLDESENVLINEKSRVTELESLVAKTKKECEDLGILLESSDKNLTLVTEEKQLLDSKLQERIKEFKKSEELLKGEKMKVTELESTVDRVKEEYQELQNLLTSKEENLSQLNANIKSMEDNLEETKKKLDESEIAFSDEKSKVTELETLLARTKNESEDLKAHLESSEKELSDLKNHNESLELNLQDSEKKLEESETSLKNEKSKVAEFEITVSTLQKNFDILQDELRSNKESLAMEESKVADLELIVARGKKDSEDLQNILDELRTALENEKTGTAELKDMVSRSQITCEELETLLRSKEDLLRETTQRASSLNSELEACRLKISDLESSLLSESSRSAELQSECSREKEHSVKVEAELASKVRLLEETEIMKTNAETELNKLNAEMRVMESDLEKLRKELSQVEDEKKQSLMANEKIEEYARNADNKIVSLEAKIVDYERSVEQLDKAATVERQNVDSLQSELAEKNSSLEKLTLRLEETEKRESATSIALEATKKKVAELTELGEEVESQLAQEREQLTAIRAEKKILTEELASYVRSEADLMEQISKIMQELKDTDENLQEQLAAIATLRKDQEELQEAKSQLENELKEEQQKSNAILTEKLHLEQELASNVQLSANMKEQLSKIEKDLEDSDTKLKNQQETNSMLEEKNLSLTENIDKIMQELNDSNKNLEEQNATIATMKTNELDLQNKLMQLENNLVEQQQKSEVTLNEKLNLEQELSKFVQSATEAKAHICKIEKELEECVRNLEKQQEANAALKEDNIALTELKNKLENKLDEMQEQSTLAEEEIQALKEEISSQTREFEHSSSSMQEKISKMQINLEEFEKNKQEQNRVIEALREKQRELEGLKEKLETELTEERAQLTELRNEKEILEEEASLFGRSNEDLGNKIVALQAEIKGYSKNLQSEREVNEGLKKLHLELNDECEKLKKEKIQDREILQVLEKEKTTLQEELSANARSQADMNEEISALHTELESSRTDLQQLREINEKLKEKITESNAKIDLLQSYESQSEKLSCDLETTKKESENLSKRTAELSEELKSRIEEITRAEKQLEDIKREKDLFISELEERIQTSNKLVASLEERLASAEESCVQIKHEEKQKQEALEVIQKKLEQLNKEKTESEVRMKEVIVNLQEVRSSQEGVLEAQAKTLAEKSNQLEEAEKELVDLKKLLSVNAAKIETEKSACHEAEVQCEKLKEQNQVQSNLVNELQKALEIEQSKVEESTKRSNLLENNVEAVAKSSANLKQELNALWDCLSKACPEIVRPEVAADSNEVSGDSEIEKLSFTVQSLTDDAKIICKAVTILTEANDKLKSNMKEIVQVSENLKLELNALWDSVRSVCPELARPKSDNEKSPNSPEISEITYAVKTFADDAKTIRKAVSILSEANETLKEHLDGEKEIAKNSAKETEKIKLELDDRITRMENEQKNRNLYLSSLVQRKKKLQELLSMAVNKRDQVDEKLSALTDKWKNLANEAQGHLNTGSSACDELKHLQVKRTELDDTLSEINDRHTSNLKPLLKTLCRIFVWSEAKLQEAQVLSSEFPNENELSEEQDIVEKEISRNEKVQLELSVANEKIENFRQLLESYEASLKSGAIKRPTSVEEKLQSQLDKLAKERKEMKDKLDAMRMRNAKMEKNMDDLRNENKKLKAEAVVAVPPSADSNEELERFQTLSEKLQKEVLRLQIENDELLAKKVTDNQDVETRLKEVHAEYGLKLEKIKQKMKTAYNEQIAKLNQEQEKAMKEKMGALRVQMEKQCRKYTEDIAKYKAHISDLSSRYWDVGEKLLTETQEKQAAIRQLEQIRGTEEKLEACAEINQQMAAAQGRLKTASLDRREFAADRAARENTTRPGYRGVEMIEEETTTYTTRRHSVKSIQAMGHAFNAEDEEGEVFDSVYLADLKEGRCAPPVGPDFDRLSELRMRNSMCRPHLKSSYAVETHFQPITLNEDDIKNGVNADDVFNDSLSQSLLPGQKPKKKDRTQGNELKSPNSRILRERNAERRTTATPRGLKNLFGTSMSKRQDENATGTPKPRRLSNIFRKQRTERN